MLHVNLLTYRNPENISSLFSVLSVLLWLSKECKWHLLEFPKEFDAGNFQNHFYDAYFALLIFMSKFGCVFCCIWFVNLLVASKFENVKPIYLIKKENILKLKYLKSSSFWIIWEKCGLSSFSCQLALITMCWALLTIYYCSIIVISNIRSYCSFFDLNGSFS